MLWKYLERLTCSRILNVVYSSGIRRKTRWKWTCILDSKKCPQVKLQVFSKNMGADTKKERAPKPGLATNSIFFCFLFVKYHWFAWPSRQINDPLSGKQYSLPFLPATPSSPSQTLEGLFELTRRPSRALDSPRVLLPEQQRCKDIVGRCAALRHGGLKTGLSRTTDRNLDCAFLGNNLFTPILDYNKSTE